MKNAIFGITPYYDSGLWVFDDSRVGLVKEPFVAGIPEIIEYWHLVLGIENAKEGFTALFSHNPMPNATSVLTKIRDEAGGAWYRDEETNMEGWLCPALLLYYETPPEHIYFKFEAKKG